MLLQSLLSFTFLVTGAIAHNSLAVPLRFHGDATAGPISAATFPCGVGAAGLAAVYDAAPIAGQYSAGGNIAVTYSSATFHTGGSCQFSVSNDKGVTWKVLLSLEGECPNANGASVPIPSSFPGGDYIFSWSWFPRSSGGQEFYQACSRINISGSGSEPDLAALPDMLVAVVNSCQVDESPGHLDLIFPHPGNQVIIGNQGVGGDIVPIGAAANTPGYGLIPAGCEAQMAGVKTDNFLQSTANNSISSTSTTSTTTGAKTNSPQKVASDTPSATNTVAQSTIPTSPAVSHSSMNTPSSTSSDCGTAWSACNAAWQSAGSTGTYTCQTDFVTCQSGSGYRRRSPMRQRSHGRL